MVSPRDVFERHVGALQAKSSLGPSQSNAHYRVKFVSKASDYCCARLKHKGKTSICMQRKFKCQRNHVEADGFIDLPDQVLVVMKNCPSRPSAFSNPIIRASNKEMEAYTLNTLLASSRRYDEWVSIASQMMSQPDSNQCSVFSKQFPRASIKPTNNDVLSCKGSHGKVAHKQRAHPGNLQFQDLVLSKATDYFKPSSTNEDKSRVVKSVIDQIKSLNPPGRFLSFNPKNGTYFSMNDSQVFEKVREHIHRTHQKISRETSEKGSMETANRWNTPFASPMERQMVSMTEESVMSSIEKRPFDGHRGCNGEGGWWITKEESKILAMNEEWWTETEASEGAKPVPLPEDNKVWLYETGRMYVGSWRSIRFGSGGKFSLCEVGYGISFEALPLCQKGNCYVGQFHNGLAHGMGRSFWLKNSPSWMSNSLTGSPIRNRNSNIAKGLPYEYSGRFQNSRKNDRFGVVTLKDGTKKVGGWVDGVVVSEEWYKSNNSCYAPLENGVDWWTHHHDYEPFEISSPASRRKSSSRFKTTVTPSPEIRREQKRLFPPNQNQDKNTKRPRMEWSQRAPQNSASNSVTATETLPVRRTSSSRSNRADNQRDLEMPRSIKPDFPFRQNAASQVATSQGFTSQVAASQADPSQENVTSMLQEHAIGHGARLEEMQRYANELDSLGLHSASMIIQFCRTDDVNEWHWMKSFHRRAFLHWLESKQSIKREDTRA